MHVQQNPQEDRIIEMTETKGEDEMTTDNVHLIETLKEKKTGMNFLIPIATCHAKLMSKEKGATTATENKVLRNMALVLPAAEMTLEMIRKWKRKSQILVCPENSQRKQILIEVL